MERAANPNFLNWFRHYALQGAPMLKFIYAVVCGNTWGGDGIALARQILKDHDTLLKFML